jgi:circadian clock protein KaiC
MCKHPTFIAGFDEMSLGGLPSQRLSLIVGGPGAGKTVFAMHCLVHRLSALGEPGIFVCFEETIPRLRSNLASFDWNIGAIGDDGIAFVDARIGADTLRGGAFDLSGLLAGLGALRADIGARTIVFDGIDMLLGHLDDGRLEQQEMARLDEWAVAQDVSVLLTAKAFGQSERDQRWSARLQYMTDCVVMLEMAATETTSSRAVRIAKYRGSDFAANPAPAVISGAGFEIVWLRSDRLDYPTFSDRVSSGIDRLDASLGGGYIKGSSVLISGAPGTSKTSLCAAFAAAACARGGKVLFISFDESGAQIIGNMRSIGLDLAPFVQQGLLVMASQFSCGRSPEEHFLAIRDLIRTHAPACLVIDPMSALLKGEYHFATMVCESVLDQAKSRGITALCTSLLEHVDGELELSASHVSTIADTWIHVSYVAREGERNRAITIVKSRGTSHSRQVRELLLSSTGIDLCDVYAAEGEVLMGSARQQKEAELRRRQMELDVSHRRFGLQAEREIVELQARVEAAKRELDWKQREADLVATLEAERQDREREAHRFRVDMRLPPAERGSHLREHGPA